jgi:uncharacterized protein (DUF342 family)
MVDFVQLQVLMKERLDHDRTVHIVDAEGPTLEDAAAEAATMLGVSVKHIEYEIIEKGSEGFLGTGKKDWKIRAYEQIKSQTAKTGEYADLEDLETAAPVIENKDGEAYVNLRSGEAFLKVVPPQGSGKKATEKQALDALAARVVKDIDTELVAEVIKSTSSDYVKVGTFISNPINDASLTIDVDDQDMKASIYAIPPGPGGSDLTPDQIILFLKNNRVYYGIKKDYLTEFCDKPIYKESILVAEGDKPINGRDAYIQYNFETNQSKVRLKEGSNGRVDFKDLNIIQNVVMGQPLAKKIPPEMGTPGKTTNGKIIPARNGKDIPLPLGENVHASDDESIIIADKNGQVLIVSGKVNVAPVYTVQGNVDLKTGNIIFLGTVIINGNVEPGFSVKAAGNIEVNGTVEKAELDAEGDIIVHQGITGKSEGIIRAGHSLWARFIENAVVESGDMVVVSDGIVNSQIDADKRIMCQGKRAAIVGGRLRAAEEIHAKTIGSPMSGTETICEVGFDPKGKEKVDSLTLEKDDAKKQLDEVMLNLQTLINIKKQRKSLPEDKEMYLHELMDKRQQLIQDIRKISGDLDAAQSYLDNLKTRGRISASHKVYTGVKIIIRDMKEDVRTEYKASTFILENGLIRVTKYEEPDAEATRGPDGYSTD